ncbi:MAG: imidazole glycerol phosphate synthase subunit HisH [Planctomycetota bacterium]|jgi:glutamine amidotransferase|nr:imidazole glycerol phosphate synthase subunit HisH [Planctomycetota bacterium]
MLAILDYGAGNIESVRLALRHVGGRPEFVRDAAAAAGATRVVFPGVGTARQCMDSLRSRGLDRFLADSLSRGIPVLAVCIGMQLLFDFSEEDGGVAALGLLPGRVRRFRPSDPGCKIPHMGWNRVDTGRRHPLLPPALPGGDFYFVHSYYAEPAWNAAGVSHRPAAGADSPGGLVYGATAYAGLTFASAVGTGSLFATQFHPEKSAAAGLDILARFLVWDGSPCC